MSVGEGCVTVIVPRKEGRLFFALEGGVLRKIWTGEEARDKITFEGFLCPSALDPFFYFLGEALSSLPKKEGNYIFEFSSSRYHFSASLTLEVQGKEIRLRGLEIWREEEEDGTFSLRPIAFSSRCDLPADPEKLKAVFSLVWSFSGGGEE